MFEYLSHLAKLGRVIVIASMSSNQVGRMQMRSHALSSCYDSSDVTVLTAYKLNCQTRSTLVRRPFWYLTKNWAPGIDILDTFGHYNLAMALMLSANKTYKSA